MKNLFILFVFSVLLFSCNTTNDKTPGLFQLKDSELTSVTFNNSLKYTEDLNPYTYRNFFNGGGVALGDINNDGLLDIFFTGNLVENRLYLNKGNWEFEDITPTAGVASPGVWSSGVSFIDLNNDGFLDIYVCKAGPPSEIANRHNELFINNGDLTFTEQSKKYGLDIVGLSVQANFFDYDRDGDLDCYLLNNSIKAVGNYDFIKDQRKRPTESGNKLLRNDNDFFVDVTEVSNIYSSAIGFGLGITVSDYNNDSWPDIFISNDFFERDYLYVNNQDGTFKEDLSSQFGSISMGSMGADAADLNNDSFTDIMVTEMLPRTIERQRTKTLFESWNKYDIAKNKGYHTQFSRNALHRNMGDSTFLEISRLSNVAASEWSWASLLFDADNDGLKDIFISNGIFKDLLDRDYLIYMANEDRIRDMIATDKEIMNKLVDLMPSKAVPNAAFKNNGDFKFTEMTSVWGFGIPSFSNGSAYGDIDNDGDLDLVINNVNMPAFLYENTTNTKSNKSITLKLKGTDKNKFAVGAKVEIYYGDDQYGSLENFPSRGFQSSISYQLLLGANSADTIDSMVVTWPNGMQTRKYNLPTNKVYSINQSDEELMAQIVTLPSGKILKKQKSFFQFKHKENSAVDFNKEQLLPEMCNNEGPKIAHADMNNDGINDYYIGGAKGQSGKLFISKNSEEYLKIEQPFNLSSNSEDSDAVFFDSDNDGDLDLYVASGGKTFSKFDFALNDRLYINNGDNTFTYSPQTLTFPSPISTSTVSAYDYDNDGDIDLFIGERFKVDTYGLPTSGYILKNTGNNKFDITQPVQLKEIGLITDSQWADINSDGQKDLVVSGEWMPISIFININGDLVNETKKYGLSDTNGLWKTIEVKDLNEDGKLDIIAGNKGENSFYKSGMRMYLSDFDKNGTIEQIICQKRDSKYYPIVDRDELISQIASLKQKLLYYKDYSDATITSIFSEKQLKNAKIFDVKMLNTAVFLNKNETFVSQELPREIQYSNVSAIEISDINNDGNLDILFGGNQFLVKPQFGIDDASKGWLLFGSPNGNFDKVLSLKIDGQIRDLHIENREQQTFLMASVNNDSLQVYKVGKLKDLKK
ncbi:VCBS repeat-containing protein [Winogradskyella alexanderae]|uniref:VCBS repeat-containing protein n=1 Tax=Winogradskyella alexanderae TaxID=2877123 RepID=A0ABS7XR65_9FLAO|nr:VCBS repeat-containing protein [Winogradskyella alexanderae]MCA0132514.1 VCBS repeat-containing protein [Winogradskyella alexanderae]